jgi:hypothetical protein
MTDSIETIQVRPLLSRRTLAVFLDLHVDSIRRMQREGRLPPPDKYIGHGRKLSPRWMPETIEAFVGSRDVL